MASVAELVIRGFIYFGLVIVVLPGLFSAASTLAVLGGVVLAAGTIIEGAVWRQRVARRLAAKEEQDRLLAELDEELERERRFLK